MRNQLVDIEGKEISFMAEFVRYGSIKNCSDEEQQTILLRRVTTIDDNKIVAQHLWIQLTKDSALNSLNLKEGIFIKFNAKVEKYTKGYLGTNDNLRTVHPFETDYHLINIKNISIIKDNQIL